MSGRISDIVIHPENENLWYVTGSGGVWKTQNSGTTWESIFDDQKSDTQLDENFIRPTKS